MNGTKITELSAADLYALENLAKLASVAMKSKTVLKQLNRLQERSLIEYDPFAAEARLTNWGEIALKEHSVA